MRKLYLMLFVLYLLGCRYCYTQSIVKTINITPGEGSVTSSLPFDKPIILKWTSKDPIVVDYAGLVIIKGDVTDYYNNWAQNNRFFMFNDAEEENYKDLKRLKTTISLNSDSKYELNILIPPLKPNKFYDIKILRRPLDAETNLYFELFSYNDDPEIFEKKLAYINEIKKPFPHAYVDDKGKKRLELDELHEFYDVYLKGLYTELAATSDKDKTARLTSKIKAEFVLEKPKDGTTQAEIYLKLFEAIQDNNDQEINNGIKEIKAAQKGFVVKKLGISDYIRIYNNDPKISEYILKFKDKDEQETAITNFRKYIDENNILPLAVDLFVFGQTLSSTTAVLDFDTRTGYTITPDFGYVYYGFQPRFSGITPYVGFQLEFRYFDKNIPFGLIHKKSPWHYLSFTSGLTLTSFKSEGKRDDFFSNKSLLLGLGWRLTSATRITFGGILFRKEDVNPLIDDKKTAVTPFIGLSIDLRLKSILNDFYSLNPTKKP